MRKKYLSIIALSLLLLLTACTGVPTITINLPTPGATNSGSQALSTGEEQQLAQQLFKQINQDRAANNLPSLAWEVGSSRVDLQACKLEYSIVSPK